MSETGHVWLHVRSLGPRLVVTPVGFEDLSTDGTDLDAIVQQLKPRLQAALGQTRGSVRAMYATRQTARLERVTVEAPGPKAGGPVTVPIAVVLVELRAAPQALWVARSPEVPSFDKAGTDPDALLAECVSLLAKEMRRWDLDTVLAAAESPDARLEPLEVSLEDRAEDEDDSERAGPPIEATGVDLTAEATKGTLRTIDGRDELVQRALATLASERRSSVLLVGPPGVGKTALVHELAVRMAAGAVPQALRDRPLLRLSANELIAGALYTGMWQQRARDLIEYCRRTGAVVFMGDPAGIVDAGRWSQSSNNLSRLLRPHVEDGTIRLICEADADLVGAIRKQEPSFVDAFDRIDVVEPADEAATEIVRAAGRRFQEHLAVELADDAVPAAIALTRRFEPYAALPGKAVSLLDEAIKDMLAEGSGLVDRHAVTEAFSLRTGLPLTLLSDREELDLDHVRSFFEQRVLGQDEAVAAMVALIAAVKAELNDPGRPLGSFLFVGPTGVGKTELTKALAEYLFGSAERVVRLDMGEYGGSDGLARLIGSAWKSDDEGVLTTRVREQPFCVVLFDEIEKAHRDVFDALLSALGEGRLTGAGGRTVDFRNAIIVMTSNLGVSARASSLGFAEGTADHDAATRRYVEAAEGFFRPEFFNRIGRLVPFVPLGRDAIRRLARREVGRLLMREGVVRRRLLVEIDEPVLDVLVDAGFHPRYGARPLQRAIERLLVQPLAELIVRHRPGENELIRFGNVGGEVTVELVRVRLPQPATTTKRRQRITSPQPPVRTPASTRLVEPARALHGTVVVERESSAVSALRDEITVLLQATHLPTFWDDGDTARATLSRLYQLERVVADLDALERRADGLVELARAASTKSDRSRTTEIRNALHEIEERLAVLRLEILGAGLVGSPATTRIRVTPLNPESEKWAEELIGMYAAWAERTGRDSRRLADIPHALLVTGLGCHDLLTGEHGLHRRTYPDRTVALARVTLEAPDGDPESAGDSGPDAGQICRTYQQGARQQVKDTRTGIRASNVDKVLVEGRIDEFVIAGVAHRRNRPAPGG